MKQELEIWLRQARRDLKTAGHNLKSRDYYAAAFFCQQSVEKGLKALYLNKFHELWKIHDLVKLAKKVEAPQEIIAKCASLTPVYFVVRYPESDKLPADLVSKEQAEELLFLAEGVLSWIEKNI